MYLRVEQRKKDFKKTWKLESNKKTFSIGHSRFADIRVDNSYPGISGVFEYVDGQWGFTHLTPPENNQGINRFVSIQGPTIIPLKDSELHVVPVDKNIQLLNNHHNHLPKTDLSQTHSHHQSWVWLVWKRNDRHWFSQFVPINAQLRWPHNKKQILVKPSSEWQETESEGIILKYKLTIAPQTNGFNSGSFKGMLDPSLRPYIFSALVACLLTGLLSFVGSKKSDEVVAENLPQKVEGTVIQLQPKKVPPPAPPKDAVAKALAQTSAPKTSSPKVSNTKSLGKVFSMIGAHSLKNIAVGTGPKTISVTAATTPSATTTSKTFKVLGSLGGGTGLHPSQFTKGLAKDGGVGLGGGGNLGGSELGQISQGQVGQGELGLLHKESEVSGGLDREVIAKYIQSQKGKILFCYERQLSANPGLFGKVAVKFQIAPGGEVETSNITESTLGNSSVESCLLQVIAQWRFPKPDGGVRVLVSYPFVFKSLN